MIKKENEKKGKKIEKEGKMKKKKERNIKMRGKK